MVKRTTRNPLVKFETTRWSLLHRLFAPSPLQPPSFRFKRIVYYAVSLLLFYLIPLILASMEFHNNLWTPQPSLYVPYLRDWNVQCMFLFTFPVLLMLLLSERRLLPKRLGDVLDAGILTITDTKAFSEFLKTWGKKYGVVNIIGQLLGLTAGVLASLGNYQYLTSEHPWTWQLTEGSVNVSGWLFLILLIPLFFFIAVFYLIRGFATIAFLHSLVKTPGIQVKLEPFHPDNSGGLSPIGGIGLRNQLVLATGGIQVVMLVLVAKNLNNPSPMLYILQVAGAALYLVGAPLMFIGPLLPFRKVMLNGKRQLLKTIGDIMQKLIEGIENQNTIADLSKDVQAVEELRSLVRKVPVWPFDAITLRRFIVLYVLPVVTIIATSFAHELPGLVKSIFRF